MKNKQIKSKQRVADHGEVFTNEREVKAMCDLVKNECERIDSRFLEPACGDGNFLAEILNRKLDIVEKRYKNKLSDYEKNSFLACTSIYGVEILEDNCINCRERMLNIWKERYGKINKKGNQNLENVIKLVFCKNIVCGNALTLKCVDENQKDLNQPIIFTERSFVMNNLVKRREFRLDVLLKENKDNNSYKNIELIEENEKNNEDECILFKKENNVVVPLPLKEFKPIDYRKLKEE